MVINARRAIVTHSRQSRYVFRVSAETRRKDGDCLWGGCGAMVGKWGSYPRAELSTMLRAELSAIARQVALHVFDID